MTQVTPDLTESTGRTVRALLAVGPTDTHAVGRCSDLTDQQLGAVAEHVGDVLIAADALKMRPWPSWLMTVLFPGRKSRP